MASSYLYGCIQICHKDREFPTYVDVTKKEFSFGRSLSCDIRILDKRISASHCLLEVISAEGAVCIRDISNSPQLLLRVNGVLKRKAILCDSDEIFLLDRKFRFQYPIGSRHHPLSYKTYISPCEVNQVQEPEQSESEKKTCVLSGNEEEEENDIQESGEREEEEDGEDEEEDREGDEEEVDDVNVDEEDEEEEVDDEDDEDSEGNEFNAEGVDDDEEDNDAPAAFVEERVYCNEQKNHMAFGETSGVVSSLQNENFRSRSLENKKRKDSVDKKQDSRKSKKKISFGPNLSPEHFDKALPVSTPVTRGRRPKSFISNTGPDQHLGTLKPLVPILKCAAETKRPDTPHVQKFKGGLKRASSSKKSVSYLSSVPEASGKVNVEHSPSVSSSQSPQIANDKSSDGISLDCTGNETSLIANPFISERFQNNERVSIPPVPFKAETCFTENLEASSSFQTEATNFDVNNSVSYPKLRQPVCPVKVQNTSQGPDSQETCKEQPFLPLPSINGDANKLNDIQIPGYSSPESENVYFEQSRAVHSNSVGNEVALEGLSGCLGVSIQGATSADAMASEQDISEHSERSVPILYMGSCKAGEVSSTSESNSIYERVAQPQVLIYSSPEATKSFTSFNKDSSGTHPKLHQSIEVMKIQNTSLGSDYQEIPKEPFFLPLPSSTENSNKLSDIIQMPDSTYPESSNFYSEQSGAILSNSVRNKVVLEELPVGPSVSTQGTTSAAITDKNIYEHSDGLVLQPPYVESAMADEVSSTSECNDICDPIVQTRTPYHSTPISVRVRSNSTQIAKSAFMEISDLVSYAEVEKPVSRQFSLNSDTSFKDIEHSSTIGSCKLSPVADTDGLETAVSSTVPVSLPSDLESMHVISAHMRKDALDSPKLHSQSVTCLTSKTSASSVHKVQKQKPCNAFEKCSNAKQSISEVTTTNVMVLRSKRTTLKITEDGVKSDSKSINLRSKSSKEKFSLKCSNKAKQPSGKVSDEKKNVSKNCTRARNLRQTKKKVDEMELVSNENLHLRNKRKCEGLGFHDFNEVLKTNFEENSELSAVSRGSARVLRTRNASQNVKGNGICAYELQSKNLRKRAPVKFQKVSQKLNESSDKKETVKKNPRQKKRMENERIPIMATGRITKRKQHTRKKGCIYLSRESENKFKNSSKPSKLSKITGIKLSIKEDQLPVSHKQKSISPLQDGFTIQSGAKYLTRNAIKNKLNKKDITRGDENSGALNTKLPLGCKTNKQSSQNIFDMISQSVGNKEMSFEADIEGKRRLRSKIALHATIETKTSLSRKKENILSFPVNKKKIQVVKKQVQLKAKISKAVKRVDYTHDSELVENVPEKVSEVSLKKPMTRAMAKVLIHA